jgi:hypothetical protein
VERRAFVQVRRFARLVKVIFISSDERPAGKICRLWRAARGIRFLVVALWQGSEKNPPSNSSIVTGRVNSSIEPSLANALHMGV